MTHLKLALALVCGLALSAAPTPVVVKTTAGVASGSVVILKLCSGSNTTFNCDPSNSRIVECKVPINVTGPNKTVKTSCKAPFPVYGFQFAMNVTSTDGTIASTGGGAVLVNGTYTVSAVGSTGSMTLTVGK